jgi:RNA-directed DNA polymerase
MATYFRAGVSSRTFSYLGDYTWRRVILWLRRKHPRSSWKQLRRRYLPKWRPTEGDTTLFNPATVAIERYRYRDYSIATPWTPATTTNT